MTKVLEGIYSTPWEAIGAINRLKDEGYRQSDISLIANPDVHGNFLNSMQIDTTLNSQALDKLDEDHRSLWEKIKDAFTLDDPYDEEIYSNPEYDSVSSLLSRYQDDIKRGSIAVLVEEAPANTIYTEDLGANPRDVIDRTHEYDPNRDNFL